MSFISQSIYQPITQTNNRKQSSTEMETRALIVTKMYFKKTHYLSQFGLFSFKSFTDYIDCITSGHS